MTSHANSASRKHVLVIDDDDQIRVSLQDIIESENFPVVTARNGQEGLELLKKDPKPSLIFLDMMMPVMNGRVFLNHFLKDQTLSKIPVYVFSAHAEDSHALGASGLIKKPTEIDYIIKLVNQYCAH